MAVLNKPVSRGEVAAVVFAMPVWVGMWFLLPAPWYLEAARKLFAAYNIGFARIPQVVFGMPDWFWLVVPPAMAVMLGVLVIWSRRAWITVVVALLFAAITVFLLMMVGLSVVGPVLYMRSELS